MKTQLKFKGSRNYLHSTDFYTWFSTAVCEENQIVTKLVFKQLIHRQCEVLFGQLEDVVEKNIVGTVELLDKNTQERTRGVIVETEGQVQESYPFDEDILVQRADVMSDEQQATSFSPFISFRGRGAGSYYSVTTSTSYVYTYILSHKRRL